MNKRIRVLPYKAGSRGAKALATALGGKCLKLTGSTFVAKPTDIIINWGNSNEASRATINNNGERLVEATNKLRFFQKMSDSGLTPRFWTNRNDIPEDAYPIVCRTVLTGHSGAGIVIANAPDALVDAPLYVEYKKKKREFRIHVGRRWDSYGVGTAVAIGVEGEYITQVIGMQEKKRRTDHENPNWQVRNHDNGFIYARSEVNPPACVVDAAKKTLEKLDIDFGAVDVIYNEHEGKAYVLEINTAPGLEGSTVEDYAKFFKKTENA